MNLTDASGSGTRIDDFLLARLIAEDAHLHFFKIDPLKLDVEMIEAKISRPFARKHKMIPVAVRDGKLIVAVVNPFDTVGVDTFRQMVMQDMGLVVASGATMGVITEQYGWLPSPKRSATWPRRLRSQQPRAVRQLKSGQDIETSDAHVNAVDFLQHAYESRASDIHRAEARQRFIRFRIDECFTRSRRCRSS
jgi:general secretion pathway protein E